MKRVGQRRGNRAEDRTLLPHCGPFVVHRALYLAADVPAHSHPDVWREIVAQDDHRPQCARLVGDHLLGAVDVAPHADREETDDQREQDPHRRQHPGRQGLQGLGTLALGKVHHQHIDGQREQGHPHERHKRDQDHRQFGIQSTICGPPILRHDEMHTELRSSPGRASLTAVAVEYGLIERNPAAGKRRRLKVDRPQRSYLDRAEQIEALLLAAGQTRRGRSRGGPAPPTTDGSG